VVRVSDSRLPMRVPPVLGLVRLSMAGAFALVAPVIEAVGRRRWTRLWLGPSAAVVVAGLALAFRTAAGHAFLLTYAITRPGDAPQAILVKLPLSMFAPAARLPFWFALLQVGMVFSISQTLVGVRRTLLVAFGAHALATAADPLWIWLGPPVGVPPRYRSFGDAGPSVAVVALLAYLAVWCGVLWLAAAIACYDATELVIFDGLSQRGHLAGTIIGVASAAVATRVTRSRYSTANTRGTAGRGQSSGQPSAPA
jgi:hypothetical protein